jgi:dTDP-4-amino-4,6-dideoxygalactose transaminase
MEIYKPVIIVIFMKVPFFVPWITNKDKQNVLKSLNQRWLTNGSFLQKFESNFQKYISSTYSIGVGSGAQALHLAVRGLGIGPGDEVIVPSFTFVATANAVTSCGAKPIFADVDLDTFNISVDSIKKLITKKTKAIIPVHYAGQSCDMDKINLISKKNNLKIIEDCAHALGSIFKNNKCGNLGDVGCFSFYPTKIITTGEGGMVTCNKPELFKKIKILKSQAMNISSNEREKLATWKYDVTDLGYNYRLDEIRSSLGFSQLFRVDEINKMRIKLASIYTNSLSKIKGIEVPLLKNNRNHIFHLYSIKITDEYPLTRDELYQKLTQKGIGTSVQYTPIHLMSYYKKKNKNKSLKNSEKLMNQVLCLPIFPKMTLKEIQYVIKNIKIIN